jgi:tricorn protease
MTAHPTQRGYLRFPTIHLDTVVFACEDDLWSVPARGGAARRLTAGVSEAGRPRLSPDGELVAFVGADDGPTEMYVLPLAGGPARRLTFQAARCVPVGWRPGSRDIVYASTAGQPAGFGARLFTVPADGGPPRPLPLGPADTVAYAPDGRVVVGRNTADPARWKRYRGGCAGELWIGAGEDGPFDPLLALPGNVAAPCWVGDRIYFVSDHEDMGNVYSCGPDGADLRRHSDHRDFYARNLTADGQRLVYHAGGELHLLDPDAGRSRPVRVDLASTRTQRGRRFVTAANHVESAALSPDGTTLAVVSRGHAFTLAHWSGPVRRHGRVEGARYRLVQWLAEGRQLVAVAADERPEERLVLLSAEGGEPESELAVGDPGYVTELLASPATSLVAFTNNRQQLWTVDTADPAATPRLLDDSPHERIEDLAWSPDGRWLAYTYPDTPRTTAIKLAEPATGRTHRVTEPVLRDARPAFDPDGRYLYFLGQRDLVPEHDQVQFSLGFPFGTRPYLVTLRDSEPSPFTPYPQVPGRDPVKAPVDRPPTVEVDLAGIERRAVALPVPEGRYSTITGLSGKVLLLSVPIAAPPPGQSEPCPEGTVTRVDLTTGEVSEDYLTPVDELSADPTGAVLLYRCDCRLRVLKADGADDLTDGAPGPASGWVDLERVRFPVHPAAEWRQMFREAWRLQRECFWDAGMSGVDWPAMYRRYAPLADLVASRAELSDLLWELQGELGTSHAYERGGEYREVTQHSQGFLGVDWAAETTPDGTVRWSIGRALRGDPWDPDATSPCNRLGADIRPGDVVVALNGQPVGPAGPDELLVGQARREVELTLLRDGSAPRRVTVRAVEGESRARYRDWVDRNRATVRALSDGRLGYLHVPNMGRTGYAEFVRGFLAELDCEGLIVDVRFNGGGNISPLLLDRLARRRSGAEHGRWSGAAPYPAESPAGPMAVLVNEHTGSDGEIFGHVFRELGLGVLIGRRTWGGVIATWPRHSLVDGTVTTQPEFRYHFPQVEGRLENHGVVPDLEVDNPPHHRCQDSDRQVAAAVGHLLAELGGAATVPAARADRPALTPVARR